MTYNIAGIEYKKPKVYLLNETGIGTAEYAGRTAYNSFDKSENREIEDLYDVIEAGEPNEFILHNAVENVRSIKDSKLLNQLAWVHFHHSVLEHANLSYLIKGMSRGVLQEYSRHRIQSLTVQSTRYTMSNVLYAFLASTVLVDSKRYFVDKMVEMDILVLGDEQSRLEYSHLFEKLFHQYMKIGPKEFRGLVLSKEGLEVFDSLSSQYDADKIFNALLDTKQKRNVGDSFKWIVTDNWKVDLVATWNLRSLKNFFDLRDSGAAYFQIRELAKAMKEATPEKYLKLIVKS
jgi:thymidylate synthase (FAD)